MTEVYTFKGNVFRNEGTFSWGDLQAAFNSQHTDFDMADVKQT